ncbi:hypothetical protein ACCC88_06565 [Sphingomonas sp. Sphisp140]|uniref:hypothetical protein n=1 Tax=unclassified Sphingomonas TaxID=196159 RepID=UPI0039AF2548
MTSKTQLLGALASLAQTLAARTDDASHDDAVFPRWFGTLNACNAVARRAGDWENLSVESPNYTDLFNRLVQATNWLAIVRSRNDWLDALGEANMVIADIDALLKAMTA